VLPFLLVATVASVNAQQQTRTTLTLEEAIQLAREHNPDFQALRNDADVADWNVREAYGQLLPGASASTSFQYQASGPARFGIFTGADLGVATTPEYYSSSYNIGLNYSLSGASLLAPPRRTGARWMRRSPPHSSCWMRTSRASTSPSCARRMRSR
jgi:outer membrane protein TolC